MHLYLSKICPSHSCLASEDCQLLSVWAIDWENSPLLLEGKRISTLRANSYNNYEVLKHRQTSAKSPSQRSGLLPYPQVLVLSLSFVFIYVLLGQNLISFDFFSLALYFFRVCSAFVDPCIGLISSCSSFVFFFSFLLSFLPSFLSPPHLHLLSSCTLEVIYCLLLQIWFFLPILWVPTVSLGYSANVVDVLDTIWKVPPKLLQVPWNWIVSLCERSWKRWTCIKWKRKPNDLAGFPERFKLFYIIIPAHFGRS